MQAYCPHCFETLNNDALDACRRCGQARPSGGIWPKDIYLGQVIDNHKYRVERILGSGGFGKVYLVRHTMLTERVFAIKVLTSSMVGDPEREAEFLQEVRILLDLHHPNIVTCHDVGRLPTGALFIRMEHVEGKGLHTTILPPRRLMSPARVVHIARQIADALALAHSRNILHRDLKPANILLLKDDEIRVIDFGIAKILEEVQDHQLSRVIGTPDYMAPEQFEPGQPIDGRLDVYQLGAVMHYLLTGKPPYHSARTASGTHRALLETARLQEERRDGDGPRPGELQPERLQDAPALDKLVGQMLSTKASRRPDAKTLLNVLDAIALDQPVPARHSPMATARTRTLRPDMSPKTVRALSAPTKLLSASTPQSPSAQQATSPRAQNHSAPNHIPHAPQTPTPLQRTGAHERTVASIPPKNIGPDADSDLAEGLTEDLTDTLSMLPQLKIRPQGVVQAQQSQHNDPQTLGQALNVQTIIEGSTRRAGTKVQIRVRLISVHDGFQIWAQRFVCPLDDIFTISDDICTELSTALKLNKPTKARSAPPPPAAADMYLRARHKLRQHWHWDVSEALNLFDQALALAPEDPLILAWAAVARARQSFRVDATQDNQLDIAQALAERALQADPDRVEPHYARGLVHQLQGEHDQAIRVLHAALERSSSHAESYDLLGRLMLDRGPIDAAIKHLRTALALDPALYNTRFDLARAHALKGQWANAQVMLVTDTDQSINHDLSNLLRVRFAMWRRAPLDEDRVPAIEAPSNNIQHMTNLVSRTRQQGHPTEDDQHWLSSSIEQMGNTAHKTLFLQYMAEVSAYAHDYENTLRAIEIAIVSGLTDIIWLHHCPLFAPLSTHSRFIALRNQNPLAVGTALMAP